MAYNFPITRNPNPKGRVFPALFACRKTMILRASAPQRRAKSRLRRLRSARGLRAVCRGNPPVFRTFFV